MANEQNLIPIRKGQLSKEELKRRQSNGGKKSGKVRAEKKLMKEVAQEALLKIMSNGKTFQELSFDMLVERIEKGEINNKDLVDIIKFIRDTAGQEPVKKNEVTGADGAPLVQKVFISPKEAKDTDKLINDTIKG